MADIRTKYLTFTKATSTGAQSVNGVGFRGKALILWSTYQTATGSATGAEFLIGMTDGTTQSTRYINHPGGETETTSAQAERTNRIAWRCPTGTYHSDDIGDQDTVSSTVEGTFTSFDADGFTITWGPNDSDAAIVHVLVFGGDDLQVAVKQVKVNVNAVADIVVTGVGFQPTGFIGMVGVADEFGTGDYSYGAPYGSMAGFGFSNGVDENVCGWTLGRGTGTDADCRRGQHDDRFLTMRAANVTAGGDLMSATITATSADGFTLRRTNGTTANQPVQHILCLRGVHFSQALYPAYFDGEDPNLDLPFRPKAILFQTSGRPTSSFTYANDVDMSMAIGAWSDDGTCGGTWIGGVDGASPSVYRRKTYDDLALQSSDPVTGDVILEATVTDVRDDGIDLTITPVSFEDGFELLYMAIGELVPVVGSIAMGTSVTVTQSRSFALGLDGLSHTHSEEGTGIVYGRFKFDGQYAGLELDGGPSGASKAIDWNDGNTQYLDLTASCTLTLSNPIAGGRYLLVFKQGGSGSYSVTWPASVKWAGGAAPTLSTSVGAIDIVTLAYSQEAGAIYLAAANTDFS